MAYSVDAVKSFDALQNVTYLSTILFSFVLVLYKKPDCYICESLLTVHLVKVIYILSAYFCNIVISFLISIINNLVNM